MTKTRYEPVSALLFFACLQPNLPPKCKNHPPLSKVFQSFVVLLSPLLHLFKTAILVFTSFCPGSLLRGPNQTVGSSAPFTYVGELRSKKKGPVSLSPFSFSRINPPRPVPHAHWCNAVFFYLPTTSLSLVFFLRAFNFV